MNFGFSYVGLIFLIMLMLPNIAWTKNQPKDYEKYVVNENKVLLAFERIGEVLVSCAALIFSDFNFRPWSSRSWWLVLSFALMVLYEIYLDQVFQKQENHGGLLQQYSGHTGCGSNAACSGLPFISCLWEEYHSRSRCFDTGDRTYRNSFDT